MRTAIPDRGLSRPAVTIERIIVMHAMPKIMPPAAPASIILILDMV